VSGLAKNMAAGRVAEMFSQVRKHGVDNGRIDRGRGVVVEVDGSHAIIL
jgi:hypothetical protein